eukprot:15442317-Alexandrium_andersonii.AAC.1
MGALVPAGPVSAWCATSPVPVCQLASSVPRARDCGLCPALGLDPVRGHALSSAFPATCSLILSWGDIWPVQCKKRAHACMSMCACARA